MYLEIRIDEAQHTATYRKRIDQILQQIKNSLVVNAQGYTVPAPGSNPADCAIIYLLNFVLVLLRQKRLRYSGLLLGLRI